MNPELLVMSRAIGCSNIACPLLTTLGMLGLPRMDASSSCQSYTSSFKPLAACWFLNWGDPGIIPLVNLLSDQAAAWSWENSRLLPMPTPKPRNFNPVGGFC
jgi:hypothetical protein